MAAERGESIAFSLENRRQRLSQQDSALATELVYGVLRRRPQLDWLVLRASGRLHLPVDPEVATALRMGAYQLRFLERIPNHAAVSESVDLVKQHGKQSAAGLVNALLRKLPQLPKNWPDDPTRLSMPAWLLDRWRKAWGSEAADAAALAAMAAPQAYIRAGGSFGRPEDAEETEVKGCYVAPHPLPAGFRVQDIGSQWVGELLDVQPGDAVLDLCAAPGNKTAQALESSPRVVVACDASPRRLRAMLRSGLAGGAQLVRLDAAQPLPFGQLFDRILVDAPCSGTGTLARNPDIKWRLTVEEITRHAERQMTMLMRALECLKPGGRLVYSTCSLEPEENAEVIAAAASGRCVESYQRLPGRDAGDGFQAAVIT
jgi:16S rRNA (cytosine967-C5)-methyltransferase